MQLKNSIYRRIIRIGKRQSTTHQFLNQPQLPNVVREALSLSPASILEPKVSAELTQYLKYGLTDHPRPNFYDLFFMKGDPLPCWQQSDLTLVDDWLTSPNNYPLYYLVFQRLTTYKRKTRLLEIGVRTGYLGVVFAMASLGPSFYQGVDPNLYVSNGLQIAGETFKILRSELKDFDFSLIEGFSWNVDVQNSLKYSGPYDIIHVDGDHTLRGKLIDLDLARNLISQDGTILVDDYDYHPIVADAIKRAWTLGWFKEFAYISSMRGLAVLRV